MIDPTEQDIGRKVVYTGNRYAGGKLEEGVITSFNNYGIFVRYGSQTTSQSTSREDLEWISAVPPTGPAELRERSNTDAPRQNTAEGEP